MTAGSAATSGPVETPTPTRVGSERPASPGCSPRATQAVASDRSVASVATRMSSAKDHRTTVIVGDVDALSGCDVARRHHAHGLHAGQPLASLLRLLERAVGGEVLRRAVLRASHRGASQSRCICALADISGGT